jgi:hypothetical protein
MLTLEIQFFGAFAAFSLAFWFGIKSFVDDSRGDLGTIVMCVG